MKRNNIIKSVLIAMMFSTFGCTKYLDLDPLGEVNGEQVWGTADGCRQLLAGSYAKFRKVLLSDNPFYVYGDLPANRVLKANEWNWAYIQQGTLYKISYLESLNNWTNFYQVITACNTLLKHVYDVPVTEFNKDAEEGKKERDRIAGEANFLYAYTNFWLVRIWRDVPLVKEAFESVNQALVDGSTVPRKQSTPQEVLEYSLKRLDDAIVNLSYAKPGEERWGVQADKGAALALKGHIALWLANFYKGEERYNELVQLAEESLAAVIANGNRRLADYSDPDEVYEMFDGRGVEAIFELNVSVDQNESFYISYNSVPIHCKTYWQEDFSEYKGTGSMVVPDMSIVTELYSKRDIRREIFFTNLDNPSATAPSLLIKYATGMKKDPNQPELYYANSNVPLMRLTDIYLLRAEALYKLQRYGQARSILNTFRNRAGIGNFTGSDDDLLVGIFDERTRELVGEGHTAFDRIRNDYWTGCNWYNSDRIKKRGCYWGVDMQNLLSSNRALVQIPYWQGR